MRLSVEQRETAAMYICAMLEGLYLQSGENSDSSQQGPEVKKK